MSNIYYIEDVIFYADQKLLVSNSDSENKIVLTAPASQCLELLIASQPEVVSHDVFFREIWESRGMQIPHNTLYQNISQIRKALKSLSAGGADFIITVPRTGFRLSAEIKNLDSDDISFMDSYTIKEPGDNKVVFSEEESHSSFKIEIHKKNTFSAFTYVTVFLFIICIAFAIFIVYFSQAFRSKTFDDYSLLIRSGGCEFFTNPDIKKDSAIINYIKKEKNRCDIFPYVYVSAPPGAATVSAMSCDKPLSVNVDKRKCVTFIYYGVTLK